MKNYLPLLLLCSSSALFSQTSGPNDPSMAVQVPNPSCLGCPGSVWNNETNVYLLDNNVATVGLMQAGQCFQSTCYYSRYLYAYNFGFAIPGNATITGITVDINHQSGNTNSATDSTVRLIKTSVPVGANRASTTPWPLTAAYASYGNANDLWGDTWTPAEVNASTFGVYLRVYNQYSNPTTPMVNHIRITIDYTTTTGIHLSQTSDPSLLNAYQQEQNLDIAYVLERGSKKVTVRLLDMVGKELGSFTHTEQAPGNYHETVGTGDLIQGIYFVQLLTDTRTITRKVIISH